MKWTRRKDQGRSAANEPIFSDSRRPAASTPTVRIMAASCILAGVAGIGILTAGGRQRESAVSVAASGQQTAAIAEAAPTRTVRAMASLNLPQMFPVDVRDGVLRSGSVAALPSEGRYVLLDAEGVAAVATVVPVQTDTAPYRVDLRVESASRINPDTKRLLAAGPFRDPPAKARALTDTRLYPDDVVARSSRLLGRNLPRGDDEVRYAADIDGDGSADMVSYRGSDLAPGARNDRQHVQTWYYCRARGWVLTERCTWTE